MYAKPNLAILPTAVAVSCCTQPCNGQLPTFCRGIQVAGYCIEIS